MKDLMIDIETVGNHYNSAIVEIAGVYFDRYTGELGKEIDLYIDHTNSIMNYDLYSDEDTLDWWSKQDLIVFNKVFHNPKKMTLLKAVNKFNKFVENDTIVWSHASFDPVILKTNIEAVNKMFPFHYRNIRDLRTLVDMSDIDVYSKKYTDKIIDHHLALSDCKFQIGYVVDAFKKRK